MARSLSEIYRQAKNLRDNNLELTEFADVSKVTMVDCFKQVGDTLGQVNNPSKMSILDAFTWVSSACIWAFENLLDVFKVDLARDLQNRINGTPAYFANALLKYQSGDELIINEEGTACIYANVDPSKRVITRVSYVEADEEVITIAENGEEKLMGFHDKKLVLKIATGEPGAYRRIEESELIKIRAYLNKLLFAGQRACVVSRNGDVLVPKVTVYYDGSVTEDEVFNNIRQALNNFVASIEFDGVVYSQKIIDCIQHAEHVTDVEVIDDGTDHQGIYIAQYNDDNILIRDNGEALKKASRYFTPNSGYLKESSKSGEEAGIPTWKESIVLKIESKAGVNHILSCTCDEHCKCRQ